VKSSGSLLHRSSVVVVVDNVVVVVVVVITAAAAGVNKQDVLQYYTPERFISARLILNLCKTMVLNTPVLMTTVSDVENLKKLVYFSHVNFLSCHYSF